MNDAKRQIAWGNVLFLTLSPVAAAVGAWFYVLHAGFHWSDAFVFLLMYVLTAGMGISAGYHRRFAHKSYECHGLLDVFYLLCGAAALQNSVLRWSRDHRVHHQHIDREDDPYNIQKGFFHAHMGWILYDTPHDRDFSNVPDLLKNKWIVWQDRYYLPLAIATGFLLPTLIGWAFDRPLGGFLWGGLVRTVVVHHLTFFINSLAHMVGKRPFTEAFSARDSWWLAFLTYGEGFHNFHHRFAADYRNGYRWYHWDPTKWWVSVMKRVGLVTRTIRYRKELLLKARIETDLERIRRQLQAKAPERWSERIERRLQEARRQLETAAVRWENAKAQYRELKRSAVANSARARDLWKLKMRQYHLQFEVSQAKWALLIAAVSRLSHHGPWA